MFILCALWIPNMIFFQKWEDKNMFLFIHSNTNIPQNNFGGFLFLNIFIYITIIHFTFLVFFFKFEFQLPKIGKLFFCWYNVLKQINQQIAMQEKKTAYTNEIYNYGDRESFFEKKNTVTTAYKIYSRYIATCY